MTSEHAYQAAKFTHVPLLYKSIQNARSAHQALKLARRSSESIRPDWTDEERLRVMRGIVSAKFEEHDYIQRKLEETGDAWLIENSSKDSFWGRGPDWRGQNHLGRIWMELRYKQYGF